PVIQAPGNRETAIANTEGRSYREGTSGRWFDNRAIPRAGTRWRLANSRDRVQGRKACRSIDRLDASGIADCGRQSERAVAVECVGNAFSEVVVVDAIAGPNGSLSCTSQQPPGPSAIAAGRVSKSDARGDVLVIPRPIRLLAVGLSGERKLNDRIVDLASQHRGCALFVIGVETQARGYLRACSFIRRLQQGIAQSVCECEIGLYSPLILPVPFPLMGPEMPGNVRSFWQSAERLGQVVVRIDHGDQPRQSCNGEVVVDAKRTLDSRERAGRRIQAHTAV